MASTGEQLRSARIARNLTIEEIANQTKIRSNIILAIENDDLDVLPAPYMKSFIRSYAQFLKMEDALTAQTPTKTPRSTKMKIYEDIPSAPPEPLQEKKGQEPPVLENGKTHPREEIPEESPSRTPTLSGTKRSPKIYLQNDSTILITRIVWIALGLGVLAVAYYFIFTSSPPATVHLPVDSAAPVEIRPDSAPIAVETNASGISTATVQETAQQTPQDSLILEVKAMDSVWFNIVIDGRKSSQFIMEPHTSFRWSADKMFTLSLGNAGAVQCTLNGQVLKPLGKVGAIVRNVRITRNGITTSNLSFSTSDNRTQKKKRDSIPSITPVPPPKLTKPHLNSPLEKH